MATSVMIAIQARCTSTRLPGKVLLPLGGKPIYRHVVDNCLEAAAKISTLKNHDIKCNVNLLVPTGDRLTTDQSLPKEVRIISGPEDDVLTRYMMAANEEYPDYVCRITADCPLLHWSVIFAHIKRAVQSRADYVSNTLAETRTSLDGHDVEVMSLKLLRWLDASTKDPKEREHVTALYRRIRPVWAVTVHVIHQIDLSHIKLSIDTQEDYEAVVKSYEGQQRKIAKAKAMGHQVYIF